MNIALDTSKKAKALRAQFAQVPGDRHLELFTFESYDEEVFAANIQMLLDALSVQTNLSHIMQDDEITPATGRWLATNLLSLGMAYNDHNLDRDIATQINEAVFAYVAGKANYSEIGNRCRLFANDPQWDDAPTLYSKSGTMLDTGTVTGATFSGYVAIVSQQHAAVIWGSDED